MDAMKSTSNNEKMIPIIDITSWTRNNMNENSCIDKAINDTTVQKQQQEQQQEKEREPLDRERLNVVHAVRVACERIGFFAIIGHNISSLMIEETLQQSDTFFHLPNELKLKSKTKNEKIYPYGYKQSERLQLGKQKQKQNELLLSKNNKMDTSSTSRTTTTTATCPSNDDDDDDDDDIPLADLKETFSIGPYNPASGMPPRQFPNPYKNKNNDNNNIIDKHINNDNDNNNNNKTDTQKDDTTTTKQECFDHERFQMALETYYKQMEQLSIILLRIMAYALEVPDPEHWFHTKMTHHCSALRMIHYYPIENKNLLPNNAIRCSPHTDYGVLTILKSAGPGLQVKKDTEQQQQLQENRNNEDDHHHQQQHQQHEEEWIDAPEIENGFIINLGDLMPRWTNDKWVSTLHRVVIPTDQNNNTSSPTTTTNNNMVVKQRQSIAYFCNVNGDTIIETIESCCASTGTKNNKYEPITAMEHLMSKHLASMAVTE